MSVERVTTQEHRTSLEGWRKGFWSLFATQFQGAFSDNVFKFVVMFLVFRGLSKEQQDELAPLIGAVFALPFILFSMLGGTLANRYSKRTIVIGTKIAEIIIMSVALTGLLFQQTELLIAVVFLMSTQSAFFGPSKFGLLPEMLPPSRLSWGNGYIAFGTFIAIIAGTAIAGQLTDRFSQLLWLPGLFLVGLAIVGLLCSLGIQRIPAADPQAVLRINFLPHFIQQFRAIRRDRPLFLAIIGTTYFWFLGAGLQLALLFYGKTELNLSDSQVGYLMAALAIGIGTGSCLAGYLSKGKIEYGLVPLGALGMTLACLTLARPEATFPSILFCLMALGLSGGLFEVPLAALVQQRPAPKEKASVIAFNAVTSFTGILSASIVYYICSNLLGMTDPQIFIAAGTTTFVGSLYAFYLLPDSLLRFLLLWLTCTIYRIKAVGRENIPSRGGALLVSNHLSFVDALLLQASMDRPIRFIMYQGLYDKWWLKPFVRLFKVIPIASQSRPKELLKSLKTASQAIREGELVCIFAEGQITRTGQLLPFKRGIDRIMKDADAPIVPVNLDGLWGSIFSFERDRFIWKMPHRIPYPVTVSCGRPMPPSSSPKEVRQAVQELNTEAWGWRKDRMKTIPAAFLRSARWHPFRHFMADQNSEGITVFSALTKCLFLCRRLRPHWESQDRVGILLPPSIAGVLVNFSAWFLGKTPVNLNYTLSVDALESCIRQCDIRNVITSQAFIEHLKLDLKTPLLHLEEVAKEPKTAEKLRSLCLATLCPFRWLSGSLGGDRPLHLDDVATIIFSSGSTGDPKGVELTHYNISSNVDQITQTFSLTKADAFLGILPFFHSFGFTGTMVLPALSGVRVVYHPNPLDTRAIGELVSRHQVTFLLGTPTFLQIYMRGCTPEQFGSLQFAMVGAEKLPDRLAQAFEEKFGLRPLEAFGCTECAPGVAVNTKDHREAGIYQVGGKRGSIGHPLPGISVRIVDIETGTPIPPGTPGLLMVKGPNVMKGYLNRPDKTAEVLQDGWYHTGDVAKIDDDGFLQITDRLSRFSKIGGEMVPHIKIEEVLHEILGTTDAVFAVTGVPDEKKGERIIVLYTLAEHLLPEVLEKLVASDLPNLWKPKKDQFIHIEALPYLGTGKLDLRRLRQIATEHNPRSAT